MASIHKAVLVGSVSALLVGAIWLRGLSVVKLPQPVDLVPGAGVPHSVVIEMGPVESAPPDDEPRWGRAERSWDPEHWPPNRLDWSDDPSSWELRGVAEVSQIPEALRTELKRLDCTIPAWRADTVSHAVVTGELERAGQVDMAILCVHSDKSSSTYVFWNGEPSRREAMLQSGNSISIVRRADVEARVDTSKRLDPDMPTIVEHDALEIGCCECCSTIFYRHGGKWFTLPGAD
jgi:hypothetical protein